jgi:hypothetical protein
MGDRKEKITTAMTATVGAERIRDNLSANLLREALILTYSTYILALRMFGTN